MILELAALGLRVAEALVVAAVGILAAYLLGDWLMLGDPGRYVRAGVLGALAYALLAELTGSYDVDAQLSLRNGWMRALTAWFGAGLSMLTLAFFLKTSDSFSRGWVGIWFVTSALLLCLLRAAATIWLRSLRRRGLLNRRVAIYGGGEQGNRLAEYIAGNWNLMVDMVGVFDDRSAARAEGEPPLVAREGDLEELIRRIRNGEVDQVIIAMSAHSEERLQEVLGQLAMLPVLIRLAPYMTSLTSAGRSIVVLGELPLMTLLERPISGLDSVLKRIEDLVLASLLIVLVAPLMIVAAIAVKLDSPGEIFFRQPREGFNHNVFRIWKFRTMYTNRLEYDEIRQARKSDDRITRVGRILRATSIDELPQLFNVISGDMSLVGPRPHASSTKVGNVPFSEVAKEYAARHRVKPGITGWAQVNGWRGETDTDEKLLKRLECDLFYIENWTIGFDLYILARTIAAVFPRRDIY